MESLSYSIATAERMKHFIHAEVRATDNKVTNDRQALQSKAAKAKVGIPAPCIVALQLTGDIRPCRL